MDTKALFSKDTTEWGTPTWLIHLVETKFGKIDLDVAASAQNHACERWFGKEQDGLVQPWEGKVVWCNPPYGRDVGMWLDKAKFEVLQGRAGTVVMLLPARTDTRWFHEYAEVTAVYMFKGRLKFLKEDLPEPEPFAVCFEKVKEEVSKDTTGTAWWREYEKGKVVYYLRGKLSFLKDMKPVTAATSAPFPSLLMVFGKRRTKGMNMIDVSKVM
jgi:phage N-6-adenine-methyltransferase